MRNTTIWKPSSLLPLVLLALSGTAWPGEHSVRIEDLVGLWKCWPTLMNGPIPGSTISVVDQTTRFADGSFSGETTTVISVPGQEPMELLDRSSGEWKFDADVLSVQVKTDVFVSASDPSISQEIGQKALDDQLSRKSVYQSRILTFDGTSLRTFPVGSMFKEAEVETKCERLAAASP